MGVKWPSPGTCNADVLALRWEVGIQSLTSAVSDIPILLLISGGLIFICSPSLAPWALFQVAEALLPVFLLLFKESHSRRACVSDWNLTWQEDISYCAHLIHSSQFRRWECTDGRSGWRWKSEPVAPPAHSREPANEKSIWLKDVSRPHQKKDASLQVKYLGNLGSPNRQL